MACEPRYYQHLLTQYDVIGARDSQWWPNEGNLLVEVTGIIFSESDVILKVKQFSPEGLGCMAFDKDHMSIPADSYLQELTIVWQPMKRLPDKGGMYWLRNVSEDMLQTKFHFHAASVVMPLKMTMPVDRPVHLLELYAGGYGGWKNASSFMESFADELKIDTIAVEHDLKLAMSYACSHDAKLFHVRSPLPPDSFCCIDKAIICDDVHSLLWQEAVAEWGVDVVSISSPCPPWSGAADAPGLKAENGRLLMESILNSRFMRPHFLVLEQVNGFAGHGDKVIVEKALHMAGFRIMWQKTLNVSSMLKTSRPRWLAVAVRIHAGFSCLPTPAFGMSIPPRDSFEHVADLSIATRGQMYLSEDNVRIASDPDLVMSVGGVRIREPAAVLNERIYDGLSVCPTFMAKYGTQHLLPIEYLRKHKYYGHFCKDELAPAGCRHWHPVELVVRHGLVKKCWLFEDNESSWLLLGNMITPVQAMVPLTIAVRQLIPQELDLNDMLKCYQLQRLAANEIKQVPMQGGYFVFSKGQPDHLARHEAYAGLFEKCDESDPGEFVWNPDVGLMTLREFLLGGASQTMASQVSMPDPMEVTQIDATAPFQVILKGSLKLVDLQVSFWFSAGIPFDHLSAPWNWQFAACTTDLAMSGQPHIEMSPIDVPCIPEPVEHVVFATLIDQEVTLLAMDERTKMLTVPSIQQIGTIPHDQFGPLDEHQTPDVEMLVLPTPVMIGHLSAHLPVVLAAFQHVRVDMRWIPRSDTIMLTFAGDHTAVSVMADFWAHVIANDEYVRLGRGVQIHEQFEQVTVRYYPMRDKGVCPPRQFALLLAVQATRLLMDQMQSVTPTDADSPVRVRFQIRPLWTGYLSKDTSIQVLEALLQVAWIVARGLTEFRLINLGKRILPEFKLRDCHTTKHSVHGDTVVLNVVQRLRGGGPSKQQQKTLQQSAIATILLEQGYPLDWVTSSVDKIVQKSSLARLQNITGHPMSNHRIKSILDLCAEHEIDLPKIKPQASRTVSTGAPWNKQKRSKLSAQQIDTSQFRVADDYFKNEDDSAALQIPELRPQATGIFLSSQEGATPWLRANQKVSSDELGLLVLGDLPVTTNLEHQPVRVPCYTGTDQMVLLKCELVQLGSKNVKCLKNPHTQVTPDATSLVALTVFKRDWNADQWHEWVHSTMAMFRKTLTAEGMDCLLAMWGRSLRAGLTPAAPAHAESVQIHATLLTSKLDSFLNKTGFNKVFATPKHQDGRLDTSFKVVWLQDATKIAGYAAQVSSHMGMVSSKNSVGIRVKEEDFETTWKLINPSEPPPSKQKGDVVYKCEGLPFGTTLQMMEAWLKAISWQAVAFKAIGPQSWLLRTDVSPPQGVITFNANPVLLRELPSRVTQRQPVILGPKLPKTHTTPKVDPFQLPSSDPWARFSGVTRPAASVAAPARQVDGPTEQRLQTQDERIATLQEDVRKIKDEVSKQHTSLTTHMKTLESNTASSFSQVNTQMAGLKKDFEGALKTSLQQNSKMMDDRMSELRAMIQASMKRSKPERAEEDMSEDGS
eukprot:Skav226385  [mRNA]  locus=scaffold1028:7824:12425:+ [translate_table: standard]